MIDATAFAAGLPAPLIAHDADMLVRLAAEADSCGLPADMSGFAGALEVLRRHVAAAAGHLELQH